MCGILAYFNRNGITAGHVNASIQSLNNIKHRGPDGEGLILINSATGEFRVLITDDTPKINFTNPISLNEISAFKFDLLLGHRRLSIIDLSTNGHQPMLDDNGNWIVFNGEIYNYGEIREELKGKGYQFKSDTDTEVILKAYQEWGEACVKYFNGMFSVVIFDKKNRCLFIVNDRFGVKPLYSYKSNSEIVLSSEIKQIFPYKYTLSYNEQAFLSFLSHGYIDNNYDTFFEQIKKFPNSCYDKLYLDKELIFQPKNYYSLENGTSLKGNNLIEQFRELLSNSVKLRLRSDVPLGFASSGGLDSSSILYLGHSLLKNSGGSPDITTFSAVFPGMEGDESEFIEIIEKDLKVKSNYTNPLNEFNIQDFEKHIESQEFPVQSTSFYAEWCVSRLVHNSGVKVLLIGQGGDEILAGYHHHFYRYCRQLILEGKITTYLSQAKKFSQLKGIEINSLHRKILNEVKLSIKFKTGLASISNKLNSKWNKADKLAEMLKMDLQEFTLPTYLRSGDRSSMAFSLEARHPFLDYRLVDFCFSIPENLKIRDGWQKWILRESMKELPEAIRYRKDKKGFTTPQDVWIKNNFKEFEAYLEYLPEELKKVKTNDRFLKYSLGVWFKINSNQK